MSVTTSAAVNGGVIEVCILGVGQPLPHYRVTYSLHSGQILITIEVIRRYSSRFDLLEQLRRVAVIVSDGGQDDGAGGEVYRRVCDPLAVAT